MTNTPDYLNPELPNDLKRYSIKTVEATNESLKGYGYLVNDPKEVEIEITRWPALGSRPVDTDSGDEGGTTEGIFIGEWKGDVLYGRNSAVGGHYVLAYAKDPIDAKEDHEHEPSSLLQWHANYHPDGGQLFYPLEKKPFIVPLALPGDGVKPEDFVGFTFNGSKGLYIHPSIWHEGVFPVSGKQRFFDKQGAVHARVSVDFAREFGCLLEVVLGDWPSL